jgi:hypothetical protein
MANKGAGEIKIVHSGTSAAGNRAADANHLRAAEAAPNENASDSDSASSKAKGESEGGGGAASDGEHSREGSSASAASSATNDSLGAPRAAAHSTRAGEGLFAGVQLPKGRALERAQRKSAAAAAQKHPHGALGGAAYALGDLQSSI